MDRNLIKRRLSANKFELGVRKMLSKGITEALSWRHFSLAIFLITMLGCSAAPLNKKAYVYSAKPPTPSITETWNNLRKPNTLDPVLLVKRIAFLCSAMAMARQWENKPNVDPKKIEGLANTVLFQIIPYTGDRQDSEKVDAYLKATAQPVAKFALQYHDYAYQLWITNDDGTEYRPGRLKPHHIAQLNWMDQTAAEAKICNEVMSRFVD